MARPLIVTACLAIIVIYARFVETNWLEVSRFRISAGIKAPVLLAHITDLHFHAEGPLERKILASLNQEKPDIIVITGDTIDRKDSTERGSLFLKKLSAPLGVWAVMRKLSIAWLTRFLGASTFCVLTGKLSKGSQRSVASILSRQMKDE